MRRLSLLVGVFVVACGGWFPLLPDMRTPADRAHAMDAKCAHESEQQAVPALTSSLVETVEPAYSTVPSGNDRAIRLRGARLHLRPSLNVSAEALQRTLECHQARVTLGDATATADDPYVLPGAWLDIDVGSSGDGLVAAVLVDHFEDARRVLDRARTFASMRP
ncbi:MAG TPA: hypothetical protein VK762_25500 [Polyangiaceae bacterium]|jgi:hypothetical protein|nr:hypothetical protein [Polyangiaceae bacterium]